MGKQAIYFYSKVNQKTLIGKSTKLRLQYKDIGSIEETTDSRVRIVLSETRPFGQDLRSTGNSTYKLANEYWLTGFRGSQR